MEIKEKLLCALRERADLLKDDFRRGCVGVDSFLYLEVTRDSCIELKKVNQYDRGEDVKTITEKAKYFWQKDKEKEVREVNFIFIGYVGKVSFNNEEFEITKEEYDEIIEVREQKIKEIQIKQLDNLCKNN